MKNQEEEIAEIIKKNLPAHVGEVLKERLEQADKDTVKLKQQETALAEKNNKITSLEKTIEEYKQFDTRNAAITDRENKVTEAERNLKIATLEFQLQSEKDKTTFTRDITLGLVRNIEYRKTIFDSQSINGRYDDKGNYIQPYSETKNHTEDKSAK